MKVKDIYALPSVIQALDTWPLKGGWITEVDNFEYSQTGELYQQLEAEGRLVVKQHAFQYIDGERDASLCSLWFDGKPVAYMQNAGRGGTDHQVRGVTDAEKFDAMCGYLRKMLNIDGVTEDLVDPEAEVYPDELLEFYGINFAEKLGVCDIPKTEGFMLCWNFNPPSMNVPEKGFVVEAMEKLAPPRFIRRGSYHFEFVRVVTADEAWTAYCARLLEAKCKLTHPQAFVYKAIERPATTEPVVRI